jgi:hypothetical protein
MTAVAAAEQDGRTQLLRRPIERSCRLCGSKDLRRIVDLGAMPRCELFLGPEAAEAPDVAYPLQVWVCGGCLLAQLPPSIQSRGYVHRVRLLLVVLDLATGAGPHVRRGRGPAARAGPRLVRGGGGQQRRLPTAVPCAPLDPLPGNRALGECRGGGAGEGCAYITAFLTAETGAVVRAIHGPADLLIVNNVYGDVPDLIGFTRGLRSLVADDGWVSIEVQHLLTLVERAEFDAIYHEHFQYYTLLTGQRALASGGLSVVDVEPVDVRGGSIRIWARPSECAGAPSVRVAEVLAAEEAAGLHTAQGHDGFAEAVSKVRDESCGRRGHEDRAGDGGHVSRAPGWCQPVVPPADPGVAGVHVRRRLALRVRPSGSPTPSPATCGRCTGSVFGVPRAGRGGSRGRLPSGSRPAAPETSVGLVVINPASGPVSTTATTARRDRALWVQRACTALVALGAAYASYRHGREFALRFGADEASTRPTA